MNKNMSAVGVRLCRNSSQIQQASENHRPHLPPVPFSLPPRSLARSRSHTVTQSRSRWHFRIAPSRPYPECCSVADVPVLVESSALRLWAAFSWSRVSPHLRAALCRPCRSPSALFLYDECRYDEDTDRDQTIDPHRSHGTLIELPDCARLNCTPRHL